MPNYPCFSSCVLLYTNASFARDDATLNNQVSSAFRKSLAVFTRQKRHHIIFLTVWYHNITYPHLAMLDVKDLSVFQVMLSTCNQACILK